MGEELSRVDDQPAMKPLDDDGQTPSHDESASGDDLEGTSSPALVVFSDDWGRHPSSCQHLVTQFLPRYRVTWVNTIGTRPPRLDLLTVRRAAGKLRQWAMPSRSASGAPSPAERKRRGEQRSPRVLSPVMWPSFRGSFGRGLNAALLERVLRRALHEDRPSIGITTIPLVADLVGRGAVGRWVYYCVDDLGAWPGLDRETLIAMERSLVDRVDEVVVVSETLKRRMAELGRESTLLTHGVDLARWRESSSPLPSRFDAHPKPLIVFWGVADRRLATDWIERLAAELAQGTVLLVGPTNNPEPRLSRLDRLAFEEPLPYEVLPALARAASVLIMPYADLPATRAMQPLKLKEYLATDRPVVVSDLPSVGGWRDACDVAGSADAFAEAVVRRIETGLPEDQRAARGRLEAETWALKAETFERLVLGR